MVQYANHDKTDASSTHRYSTRVDKEVEEVLVKENDEKKGVQWE
jgi:hypothetical protein